MLINRFIYHLLTDNVVCFVHKHVRFITTVILLQLAGILHGQLSGHCVASGGGNKAVNVVEINGRKHIANKTQFSIPFLFTWRTNCEIELEYGAVNLSSPGSLSYTQFLVLSGC